MEGKERIVGKKEMVSVVRVAVRLDIGERVVRAGAD